jgi:hypothetical protein
MFKTVKAEKSKAKKKTPKSKGRTSKRASNLKKPGIEGNGYVKGNG